MATHRRSTVAKKSSLSKSRRPALKKTSVRKGRKVSARKAVGTIKRAVGSMMR